MERSIKQKQQIYNYVIFQLINQNENNQRVNNQRVNN